MSIATAIQELINSKNTLDNVIQGINTTKGQIKSAVNEDFEAINNEQIEQYPSKIRTAIERYKGYIPTVKQEGKELSLNTIPLKGKEFAVVGDTFQQMYEGYQLFDNNNYNQIQNWFVTLNKIASNSTTKLFYIKCKPNTSYTILKISSTRLQFWDSELEPDIGITTSNALNSDYNFTGTIKTVTTSSNANYLICYYYNAETDTISEEDIRNSILLLEGSYTAETIPDYEPYVGGQATPNPDYKQDIQVVKGEQTVVKRGKNLIDITTLTDGYVNNTGIIVTAHTQGEKYSPYIKVKPGTQYTFSIIETTDTYNNWFGIGQYTGDNSSKFVKRSAMTVASQKYITFTADSTVNYIRVSARNLANATKIMLVEGSIVPTAETYEPYITPVELPLNLGDMELCDVDNNKDIIFKNKQDSNSYNAELDGGSWYKKKAIQKAVLNGTEAWSYGNKPNENCAVCRILNYFPSNVSANYISSHFIYNETLDESKFVISGRTIYLRLNNKISGVTSSDDNDTIVTKFETWLTNNNVLFYYILATPTYTKITDTTLISQLEAIENTNMNNGTTVIYADNEEGLQPTLYVEAYAKAE